MTGITSRVFLFSFLSLIMFTPACFSEDFTAGLSVSENIMLGSMVDKAAFTNHILLIGRPDSLAASLLPDQQVILQTILSETYWTIGFLTANTASLLIAVAIDPFIGGIIGIITLAGYSISAGNMAFGYRDLAASAAGAGITIPDPTLPWYASIGAAAFAIGSITAIGLSYSDYTGTATTLAYVCGTVSLVSGIIAIVTTFGYVNEAGPQE